MFDTNPLIWVKDNSGHMFLCPLGSTDDAKKVSDDRKGNCVDCSSRISGATPASRPGHIRA